MKKASRISIVIACVAMLVCVFASTVSAANTVGSMPSRFYRPIMNVASVGTYNTVENHDVTNIYEGVYKWSSVFDPPTDVLLPLELFYLNGKEYYLTNTINWYGIYNSEFNGGNHQAVITSRFYNTKVEQSDVLTARSQTTLNYMAGNTDVVVFLNETIWSMGYFNAMEDGYKVFDGLRIMATNYENMAGTYVDITWSQYEDVENNIPKLVRHTIRRYITDFTPYEENVNGTTYQAVAIPYFEWGKTDIGEALNMQTMATNDKGERLFYVQDVECRLHQNNVAQLDMFSTYDEVNEISDSVGGYLKNTTINISFDNISWTDWLVNSVASFMNFQLLPGVSLSVIFLSILGILAVKAFLNAFAGG